MSAPVDTSAPWDGVPQNPDESGYHWVVRKRAPYPLVSAFPVYWDAAEQHFQGVRPFPQEHLDYAGPCLTPAEHAALLAERDAALAAVEQARREADVSADRSYIDGLKAGWNYAVVNDHASFTASQEHYRAGISAAIRARGEGGSDA